MVSIFCSPFWGGVTLGYVLVFETKGPNSFPFLCDFLCFLSLIFFLFFARSIQYKFYTKLIGMDLRVSFLPVIKYNGYYLIY